MPGRIFVILCLISFLVVSGTSPSFAGRVDTQPQFFLSIQDMPLMPGLEELTDQTVVFDKPEGRIIELVAAIQALSSNDVKAFYEATLPQFGWSRIAENSFIRRDEHLHMQFEDYDGHRFLRIMVAPR